MDHRLDHISPLVSVVMSVYNGESYLRDAIDSVLQQSFTDFEFIIINDGSKDNSLSIIRSYDDQRMVLVDNDGNKGLIYSLNKGIELSKGKYIARMDADDLCLPERFKKQVDFLESHPTIGVVGCDYISFNNAQSTTVTSIYKSNEIKSFLLFTATMCHPTLMLRKQVLMDHHLSYSENAKHVEDYDLWTRMALHTDFCNLNQVLFKYRDHAQQVSRQYRDIQLKNSNNVQESYLKNLGFVYTEQELSTHFLIASNARIQAKENVIQIEKWLLSLIDQNITKKIIAEAEFKSVIHKMWLDCCGNTSLGLWAYRYYQTSLLRKRTMVTNSFNAKLLAKSVIRWIR
ncbi:MAG: glycosyltransferase [Bacteroidetes bacterium]|nr:glycosyltransferase [Bacteroidota bacterium]